MISLEKLSESPVTRQLVMMIIEQAQKGRIGHAVLGIEPGIPLNDVGIEVSHWTLEQ
jgi:hypothetical protein